LLLKLTIKDIIYIFKDRYLSKHKMTTIPSCLHIPSIKKSYSVELIKDIFWKHFLGKVDRVDFVPIQEDKIYHQVFIYKEERDRWSEDLIKEIEEKTYYELNFTPCDQEREKTDCWKIQKSDQVIPYANTNLNIHQLYHENALLKSKIAELENKNK
jgi:hypothetical protein